MSRYGRSCIGIGLALASLSAGCDASNSSSAGAGQADLLAPSVKGSSAGLDCCGDGLGNTRDVTNEHKLSLKNVAQLAPEWTYQADGEITTYVAEQGGMLYFPDNNGNLHKVDAETGQVVWRHSVADYTDNPHGVDPANQFGQPSSRSTPAISGNTLVIGTRDGYVIAADTRTGERLWKARAEDHIATMVTSSPVIYGNVVYIGVSSFEEGLALDPNYKLSFRGSALALDLKTGRTLWRTYMVPVGYTGGAIWSGPPAIDVKRGSVYFTSGNNYGVPDDVQACVDQAGDDAEAVNNCLAEDDYFDSVLALDLTTGAIKWARRVQGFDAWTLTCGLPFFNIPPSGVCPSPASPDYDFGSGANLFTVKTDHGHRDLVGAGQKSGIYWAFDADTGELVWATQVGPGGAAGGIMWGSATDGERIYVGVSNSHRQPYTLMPQNQTINWGAWSALDAATGKVIWQVPAPVQGARAAGWVTLANGIVYAGSFDPNGYFYAFDAEDGSVKWSFASGGSVISGATIVDGHIYWGSGYAAQGGTYNNKLYRFGLPSDE